jgi:hypothetical protein
VSDKREISIGYSVSTGGQVAGRRLPFDAAQGKQGAGNSSWLMVHSSWLIGNAENRITD